MILMSCFLPFSFLILRKEAIMPELLSQFPAEKIKKKREIKCKEKERAHFFFGKSLIQSPMARKYSLG